MLSIELAKTGELDLAVRQQVTRLLDGDIGIDDFRSWFAGVLWSERATEVPAVADVALALAEFEDEHLTHSELREELSTLIRMYSVRVGLPLDFVIDSSTVQEIVSQSISFDVSRVEAAA